MILGLLLHLVFLFLRVEEKNTFLPPLSAKEERECFAAMKRGDKAAREKLILHNMRLVAHIVKKYGGGEDCTEDLISIGTVGLIKAIDSFDPDNGARFATYGGKCLQNEILMHFRARKKSRCEVSVNDTVDVDKDGNPLTYLDIICSDESVSEEVFYRMSVSKALTLLKTVLTERERYIIVKRYALEGGRAMTQRELATEMGISRSYVSRIEKAALGKLAEGMGLSPPEEE